MKKGIISVLLIIGMLLSLASCNAAMDEAGDNAMNVEPGTPADGKYYNYSQTGSDYIYEASKEDSVSGTLNESMNAEADEIAPVETEVAKDAELPESPYYEQNHLLENPFIDASKQGTSTFSADVDTASYAYFRKLVQQGYNLSELKGTAGYSIRTEELINYFNYNYADPAENELFSKTAQIAPCPWNENNMLLVLGLKTVEAPVAKRNNLVFLIDVSGSMRSSDKLGLLKTAFTYLVENVGDDDVISIVTYAGGESVVLDGCSGAKKDKILKAVNSLEANGSTNGEAGLKKAYQIAEKHYIEGGNNRIIMASDGDLNVGISSVDGIKALVEEKRDAGVFMSVLGFGTGNYKDDKMETIADSGNGVYYYIDSEIEAEKIFGAELFSTLYTVAKDVKLQLTFNPEYVAAYRLIGYENRMLANEDFENDTKDAGELGSGHSVTVCYEIIPAESSDEVTKPSGEFMKLSVRYKEPDGIRSELEERSFGIEAFTDRPDDNFKFISAVIETAMVLHDSEYIGEVTLYDVVDTLTSIELDDEYKEQFLLLIKALAGKEYSLWRTQPAE